MGRRFPVKLLMVYGIVVVGMVGASLYMLKETRLPGTLENRVNEASVWMHVSRRLLLYPGHCTNVSWSVEGIEQIYFDDKAAVGEDTKPFCPSSAANPDPVLYIDFKGSFIQEYTIPVIIVTQTPAFRLAVGVILALGVWITIQPYLPSLPKVTLTSSPERRLLLFGAVSAVVFGIIGGAAWLVQREEKPEITTVVTRDGWIVRDTEMR